MWSERDVMMMTWEKFTMYLAAIPDYSKKDETDEKGKKEKNPEAPTGAFNLWDLGERLKN